LIRSGSTESSHSLVPDAASDCSGVMCFSVLECLAPGMIAGGKAFVAGVATQGFDFNRSCSRLMASSLAFFDAPGI
jgi:hypothetical protein